MRKILITLIAATFLVSCKKEDYTISGNIKGYKEGDYVYLEIQDGDKPKAIDSIKLKGGKFEFKGKADSLDIAFIKIPALSCMFPFVLENGEIKVEINQDSILTPKISGTASNDDLQKFNKDIIKLNKAITDYAMKNQQIYVDATNKKDMATIQKLTSEIKVLETKMMDYPKNYIKENKNFISLVVLENAVTRGGMPVKEAKSNFDKYSDELKNSRSGVRINKIINPKAEKKK